MLPVFLRLSGKRVLVGRCSTRTTLAEALVAAARLVLTNLAVIIVGNVLSVLEQQPATIARS